LTDNIADTLRVAAVGRVCNLPFTIGLRARILATI